MNGGEKFMKTILIRFAVFSFLFTSFTLSQYQVKEPLIAGGAIIKSSGSGTNYEVSATAGQLAIDSVGNSQYSIYFGFWYQYPEIVNTLDFEDLLLPKVFDLKQNYPNPFNPSTIIEYALPRASEVTIEIYNVLGQQVAKLVNENQTAGYYNVQWLGKNSNGNYVANGMYLYRMMARSKEGRQFIKSRKMLFIK